MTRIISSACITMLILSACTGTETKNSIEQEDKKDVPQFHTFTFNLDEMKELITFNAWVIANLPSDTSAYTYATTSPLDTSGIVISLRYPFRSHDYVLYSANIDQDSSMDATYLGEVLNGKIVLRDTVVTC